MLVLSCLRWVGVKCEQFFFYYYLFMGYTTNKSNLTDNEWNLIIKIVLHIKKCKNIKKKSNELNKIQQNKRRERKIYMSMGIKKIWLLNEKKNYIKLYWILLLLKIEKIIKIIIKRECAKWKGIKFIYIFL